MRLKTIQYVIFFCLCVIVCVLAYMQIIRGSEYHRQSVNNRIRVVPMDGPRGNILDRNGVELANSRRAFHVGVVPQDIEDRPRLFVFLGALLGKSPDALEKLFQRRRLTPFAPVILAEDISRDMVVKIEEEKFLYHGVVVLQGFERHYPHGSDGAHVLGYVGKINSEEAERLHAYGYTPLSLIGKNGLEKRYDALLKGLPGGRQIEVNSRGQEVRLLGIKGANPGQDVVLTVDQRLQVLGQQLLKNQRGSVIVMDLSNGDVMALVSSPTFDPNTFTDTSLRSRVSGYFNDEASPLLNRAIAGQYPPGSVFKVPLALASLQLHKTIPSTTFNCPGFMMVGNSKFNCAHVHGQQDLIGAIARSCNVYFFQLGKMLTAPIISAYAKAFGLSRLTGVDLPFETKGKVASHFKKWYTGNTLNLSIGQGDTLATPLQLTVLMATVANDGVILRPRLAKVLGDVSVPDPDFSKRPIIRLRDEVWRVVQQGLKATVADDEGTAHVLTQVKGLRVYGKTGTAQSSGTKANHAWFVGYTGLAKRNVAFCVFLEHGGSSANAVEITKELLLGMQTLQII